MIKKILIPFGIMMSAAFFTTLGFYGFTQAETAVTPSLEMQLGNLTDTLQKVFLQPKTGNTVNPVPAYYTPVRSGHPKPTCLDNYQALPHSTTYKADSNWNIEFMPRKDIVGSPAEYDTNQFLDLNGDGLTDYLFTFRQTVSGSGTSYYTDRSCVYLNNGHGFDPVYRCKADITTTYLNGAPSYTGDYYGDCARL